MLDECHKAKTVDLDESGKAKNVGKSVKCSQTAAKVVELQALLPRARIVYCRKVRISMFICMSLCVQYEVSLI